MKEKKNYTGTKKKNEIIRKLMKSYKELELLYEYTSQNPPNNMPPSYSSLPPRAIEKMEELTRQLARSDVLNKISSTIQTNIPRLELLRGGDKTFEDKSIGTENEHVENNTQNVSETKTSEKVDKISKSPKSKRNQQFKISNIDKKLSIEKKVNDSKSNTHAEINNPKNDLVEAKLVKIISSELNQLNYEVEKNLRKLISL